MARVKGGFAVAPRCAPEARTLDARQPVRPSFHQAHQGGLSPSDGLKHSVMDKGRRGSLARQLKEVSWLREATSHASDPLCC